MPCTPGCGACCDPVFLPTATAENIFSTFGPLSKQKDWVTENWAPMGPAQGGFGGEGIELMCVNYDVENRACLTYDTRPPVCRDYPLYGDPSRKADRLVCGYQAEAGRTVLPLVGVT